jgi:predicted RNase H-like HicB family nuclease
MTMRYYIALLHKDLKSDYGVSFPDLPGCITAGRTLDEARAMAVEALGLHLQCMTEDGDAIPAPSSLESVMADAANRDGVVTLIPAPAMDGPGVRVNVILPENLLTEIDRHVESHGLTRSGFQADAAKKAIGKAA